MNIVAIQDKIHWHTTEIRLKEADLRNAEQKLEDIKRRAEADIRNAEQKIRDLKRTVDSNKHELEEYERDLKRAQQQKAA